MNMEKITALRMERQHLVRKASKPEYDALYRDTQPGQNVYWNGFGDPPTITYRADFDDMEYNRARQRERALIKGRFQGGNLGWIEQTEIELFAGLYMKPLAKLSDKQTVLLSLIEREGPMNIQLMKEMTGMLVKEITPVLHRFQEAFLIYEDQHDGEWDRGWYTFGEMFPDVKLDKYTRHEALMVVLQRFAYRHVVFDIKMAKSFYKLPEKEIKKAVEELAANEILTETGSGYILSEDLDLLETYVPVPIKSIYAMHRNDPLVKANEHWLKERFTHPYPDTFYYMLIDGEFRGVVAGKFRYTPEVEDVILELPEDEAAAKKDEILQAVRYLSGKNNPIRRYQGAHIEA